MILTYRAPGHCNIGARATIPVMTRMELGACMSRHGRVRDWAPSLSCAHATQRAVRQMGRRVGFGVTPTFLLPRKNGDVHIIFFPVFLVA